MLNRLSLKFKLVAAFTLVAVALLIVGAVGYFGARAHSDRLETLTQHLLPASTALSQMRRAAVEIELATTRLATSKLAKSDIAEFNARVEMFSAAYEKAAHDYSSLSATQSKVVGSETLLHDIKNDWNDIKTVTLKMQEMVKTKPELAHDALAVMAGTELGPLFARHSSKIEKVLNAQNAAVSEYVESSSDIKIKTIVSIALSLAAGLAICLALGIVFSSSLSRSLTDISERLSGGATDVAEASVKISQTGMQLSEAATQQAAALQQTVASVDQVNAMITKNAENAAQSQEISMNCNETASKGKRAVDEMIHSIDEISRSNNEIMAQVEASNNQINEIVKVIAEIGNKTKVINDIVFQTKLLSFNASVEAARAGEHGKGFAVVAEEVGNLAQMSGNAAKEISTMLDESIRKVEHIAEQTRTNVEKLVVVGRDKVAAGTVTAKRCAEILDEIVTSVDDVNRMVSEIATASMEQAQGIREINKAMTQLDQVTQQNAASSQSSAQSSEKLAEQAKHFRLVVDTLMTTIHGTQSSVKHHASRSKGAVHKVAFEASNARLVAHSKPSSTSAGHSPVEAQVKNVKKPVMGLVSKSNSLPPRSAPAAVAASAPKSPSSQRAEALRSVSGSDVIPDENDPRFEDV